MSFVERTGQKAGQEGGTEMENLTHWVGGARETKESHFGGSGLLLCPKLRKGPGRGAPAAPAPSALSIWQEGTHLPHSQAACFAAKGGTVP